MTLYIIIEVKIVVAFFKCNINIVSLHLRNNGFKD